MNKAIAIITARGGSKRIPRKNIKEFSGQPMIKYAIDAAINSKIFNTVMVSTDDTEIAETARIYGADIPFMRSAQTSNDFATTDDVILEVINQYKKDKIEYNTICCIYPCVPFLKGNILGNAFDIFNKSDADALMPIVRFSYPIQRALRISNNKFAEYAQPEYANTRSQDLEPMYHDAGMFYFVKTTVFLQEHTLTPIKTIGYIMNEQEIQDIDTMDDWNIAEIKYKILNELN